MKLTKPWFSIAPLFVLFAIVFALCVWTASSCADCDDSYQDELEMLLDKQMCLRIKLQEVQDRIAEVAEKLYGEEFLADSCACCDNK